MQYICICIISKSNELKKKKNTVFVCSPNPNEIPTGRPDNENVSTLRLTGR